MVLAKKWKGTDGMGGSYSLRLREGKAFLLQYIYVGISLGGGTFFCEKHSLRKMQREHIWSSWDQISIPSRWKNDSENVSLFTKERSRGKMVASEIFFLEEKKRKEASLKANTFWGKLFEEGGGWDFGASYSPIFILHVFVQLSLLWISWKVAHREM